MMNVKSSAAFHSSFIIPHSSLQNGGRDVRQGQAEEGRRAKGEEERAAARARERGRAGGAAAPPGAGRVEPDRHAVRAGRRVGDEEGGALTWPTRSTQTRRSARTGSATAWSRARGVIAATTARTPPTPTPRPSALADIRAASNDRTAEAAA